MAQSLTVISEWWPGATTMVVATNVKKARLNINMLKIITWSLNQTAAEQHCCYGDKQNKSENILNYKAEILVWATTLKQGKQQGI